MFSIRETETLITITIKIPKIKKISQTKTIRNTTKLQTRRLESLNRKTPAVRNQNESKENKKQRKSPAATSIPHQTPKFENKQIESKPLSLPPTHNVRRITNRIAIVSKNLATENDGENQVGTATKHLQKSSKVSNSGSTDTDRQNFPIFRIPKTTDTKPPMMESGPRKIRLISPQPLHSRMVSKEPPRKRTISDEVGYKPRNNHRHEWQAKRQRQLECY